MQQTDETAFPTQTDPVVDAWPEHPTNIDPSEAVTILAFVFGAAGALVAIVAALFVSTASSWALLLGSCCLAALAGGSAGIVTGGMIGAILAVARGVLK
jgi:hypothetical protein